MDSKALILLLNCGGTFMLITVSVGGDSWEEESPNLKLGLWGKCNSLGCRYTKWGDVSPWSHAVRAFALVAVLASGLGVLVSLMRLCKDMEGKIVGAMFLGAGVCMLIALTMFTSSLIDHVKSSSLISWGWSYFLGWIGTIFAFICTALASMLR